MRIGFGKVDITPRVGVELCGFGPYINRHSIGVRDRLWSRAVAFQQDGVTLVLVSNDLACFTLEVTEEIRRRVAAATGLPGDAVMVQCTHTHSGPSTDRDLFGWGAIDEVYLALLPAAIAAACIEAVEKLADATLNYARVPCEGIALNREYDRDAPPLDEVLRDDWRPAKPELTDTACHVLTATAGDRVVGFLSAFGCHPVTCCAETRYIHGDFVGVATNLLEREHPGAVGLFLQGAHGDVNSCVVHKPEREALLALDVVAGRYARAVRAGIRAARPLAVDRLAAVRRPAAFSRLELTAGELEARLAEQEAVIDAPEAAQGDHAVGMAVVYRIALRNVLRKLQAGESLARPSEVHGFRLGPLALLGCPFETFQAIKNEVVAQSRAEIPVFLGLVNDSLGYATDRTAAARGGYAAQMVPLMKGSLPYRDIHTELVQALLGLDAALQPESAPTA